MLQIEGLSAGYGKRVILRDIDLTVEQGEVVCVLGANGVGKSTLLRTLAGLITPLQGEQRFKGQSVSGHSAHRRVRDGLAFVPEGQQSFPAMTVMENLQIGASLRDNLEEGLESTFALFPRLEERQGQYAGTLSGGERQMLAIARALLTNPDLLMLDEPSHGLAPIVVEQLAENIAAVAERTAILLVEQNLTIPTRCATRVVVLEDSTITMGGDPDEILQSEHVISAYLGI
ncbi:ABC transporter ATP-binding protein [Nocardioides sp. AE5]|uniref:ABC transporter ATP-binding protein n=1 Tax=Nocardioides sp. AE5 TaxID=2962573 RepID=UPI002880E195|nr:ABC transporter ATP-binding protein [Nocardioides sp. AE5]MDT0202722.1 ABC transporter ATP-binding protein [Nocardioides sp. AE5]